jgi:glycerophosphoryl diester phosphodiesterase
MPAWLTACPVAHRGLHDAASGVVENTPSAFRAAVEAGYAIECDVQVSADGEAMVYHDATLDRLHAGDGRVDTLTAAQLLQIPYKTTADRMITLGELCDLVDGRVTLVVEIKSRFDGDLRLARRTAAVLAGYKGPVAAMSFDPSPVAALRDLAPGLVRGLVAQRRDRSDRETDISAARFVLQAMSARLQFLAYRVRDLATPVPRVARGVLGLPLLTWTVRTAEDRALAARYADQIIFEGFRP